MEVHYFWFVSATFAPVKRSVLILKIHYLTKPYSGVVILHLLVAANDKNKWLQFLSLSGSWIQSFKCNWSKLVFRPRRAKRNFISRSSCWKCECINNSTKKALFYYLSFVMRLQITVASASFWTLQISLEILIVSHPQRGKWSMWLLAGSEWRWEIKTNAVV